MILIHDNLNFDSINKLNKELSTDLRFSIPHRVQTNVAIAAAITSYARIHMMQFKALPNIEVYYTDTDSFFLTGNIPENLLSNSELGLFKNELQYKEDGI